MSSKTQSPSPNPTSLPSSKSACARTLDKEANSVAGRAGSAGGIVLSNEQKVGKQRSAMNTTQSTAGTTPPPRKDATTTAASGPARQRRRPRKLNKEPLTEPTKPAPSITATNDTTAAASTAELEALKSRVRGLESKVEELYKTGPETRSGARSPRRRGKGRKGSSAQQVPTLSSTAPDAKTTDQPETAEDIEEADEELTRLEGELEVARRDLESYPLVRKTGTRPRARRSASEDTEDVEEIPRESGPGVDSMAEMGDRHVTLSGSYRIPLPSKVSMKDVKSIQSGVSAAQNVARSFLEQRKAQQAASGMKAKPAASSMEVSTDTTGGKTSWGEWFGGYSMAISRAVKNIEAEAALETQQAGGAKRPAQGPRRSSAPSAKAAASAPKATKPSASGTGAKTGPRPPLKPRAGNLSSEQVQGLMN
ncbi:hypothetical protein BCR34DRAFT_478164 [Clohesyomyces aquaticus]|uniref:Uncharacterized protein n=1 Tax=Clohesyomyces aquaticus TaxID=1231657 RepID=A0A1Y1ZYG1_9PLEO|nr:hypothetical protein BCR34DRAFT_478164 [Clohesyomyces aquaticus]